MEDEAMILATWAAKSLVGSMTSDSWSIFKERIARWFQASNAHVGEAELEATRAELVEARDDNDSIAVDELRAEWTGRIRRILTRNPTLAEELRALLEEINPGSAPVESYKFEASATDGGQVIQQGKGTQFNF